MQQPYLWSEFIGGTHPRLIEIREKIRDLAYYLREEMIIDDTQDYEFRRELEALIKRLYTERD